MNTTTINKKSINKTVFLFFVVLLNSLVFMQSATAKPLKINDARWKGNYTHPNYGKTTLSSSGKTLTTTLPKSDDINSDYTVHYRLFTNLGDPLPVTVRPVSHTQMITCNNSTPQSNQPIVQNSCTAKRYTPNDGMKRLNQPTTIKIEVRTPSGSKKLLFWKFIPHGTTTPGDNTAANQTQIYDIGPGKISQFFQIAKDRDYKFSASIIQAPGDEILNFKPKFLPRSSGIEINFGAKVPGSPAISIHQSISGGTVRVYMFDGMKTLKPGWTFEHASYRNPSGEVCRRKNISESKRSNTIFHRFDLYVLLLFVPPAKTCSKLYLQRIRLKGPKGMKPEDALKE